MPKAGLEPARGETRLILSQVRLPIPPLRHFSWFLLTYCRSEQLLLYRYGEEMSTPFFKNFQEFFREIFKAIFDALFHIISHNKHSAEAH